MRLVTPKLAESKFIRIFDEKVLNNKTLNKVYNYAKNNEESFVSRVALVSALTKDAFGCYYYVTQSLDNDKIPEDKRKFVAALDLANGILNVGIQLTVGLWIDNNAKNWLKSINVGKALKIENTEKIAAKITPMVNKTLNKNFSVESVDKFLGKQLMGQNGKVYKWLNVGFRATIMLVATQIIIKRMVVPFLATPLASWFKNNYMTKPENKEHKELKQENTTKSPEPVIAAPANQENKQPIPPIFDVIVKN